MSGLIVCTCTGVPGKDYDRWNKAKVAIKDLYGRSIEEGPADQVSFKWHIDGRLRGDYFTGRFSDEFDQNRFNGEVLWY